MMKPSSSSSFKIAFFGSSLVSAYWNGAATYYRGILRALYERGHQITFYEPDAYERQQHRDLPTDPPYAKVVVYSAEDGGKEALAMVERAARESDILVKASGVGVFDELLEAAVIDARRPGLRTAYWDVDAPATLDRMRQNPLDPLRTLVPKFDLIFTYGGGPPIVHGYRTFNAQHVTPIYNALDPTTHFQVSPLDRFTADLSLLANRLPDREQRIEEFFFRPAALCNDRQFLLGGSGWETKPPRSIPSNVRLAGHVYTSDHNAFNASASFVLNVARDSMATCGWSPATRVFEAAGAGACIITDEWQGIEAFLAPNKEVLVAKDGDDVARYLRNVSRLKAYEIGEAGRTRVLREHTYAQRARVVEQILLQEEQQHTQRAPVAPQQATSS